MQCVMPSYSAMRARSMISPEPDAIAPIVEVAQLDRSDLPTSTRPPCRSMHSESDERSSSSPLPAGSPPTTNTTGRPQMRRAALSIGALGDRSSTPEVEARCVSASARSPGLSTKTWEASSPCTCSLVTASSSVLNRQSLVSYRARRSTREQRL